MPNYCSCSITSTDTEFMDTLTSGERLFDALLPMPEELLDICTGGTTIDGVYVTRWRRVDGEDVAVSYEELVALSRKFGASDWHDWAIREWGTKWNPKFERLSPERITFETAWSPPTAFLLTVSQQFPEAEIELAYAEGGMEFWGVSTIQDGETLPSSEHHEGRFWAESDVEDEDLWPDPTPEVQAHLDKYEIQGTGG